VRTQRLAGYPTPVSGEAGYRSHCRRRSRRAIAEGRRWPACRAANLARAGARCAQRAPRTRWASAYRLRVRRHSRCRGATQGRGAASLDGAAAAKYALALSTRAIGASAFLPRLTQSKEGNAGVRRTAGTGGKRAYRGRLGKDRSLRHSRHSIASAEVGFTEAKLPPTQRKACPRRKAEVGPLGALRPRPPSADSKHHLLQEAQVRSAAVKLAGNPAIRWIVRRIIAVQEVELQSADLNLPGAKPNRVAGQVEL